MRLLLLSFISIVISACATEGPTGYKYGGGTESPVIKTCKEEMFMDEFGIEKRCLVTTITIGNGIALIRIQ